MTSCTLTSCFILGHSSWKGEEERGSDEISCPDTCPEAHRLCKPWWQRMAHLLWKMPANNGGCEIYPRNLSQNRLQKDLPTSDFLLNLCLIKSNGFLIDTGTWQLFLNLTLISKNLVPVLMSCNLKSQGKLTTWWYLINYPFSSIFK
jgi:hypothetical protein